MNLNLLRPAICIDIESTGLDIVKDRIVELAIIKLDPNNMFEDMRQIEVRFLFNPGIPIPQEATNIHGITDEMVKDSPKFETKVEEIVKFIAGCDVIGYNSNRFDIPILVESMLRCGTEIFDATTKFIDVGTIFKKKEERTLKAAVKMYLGKELEDAHSALADARATIEVLKAQVEKYSDLGGDTESLAKFSEYEGAKNYDYAGKLVINEAGEICYAIGKAKGTRVVDDLGFGLWMLDKDFSLDTKNKLRKLIKEAEKEKVF